MTKEFGHWLAGFADGEGCFHIGKSTRGARFCVFRITLHVDDEPILQEIRRETGLGQVQVNHPPSQTNARASWVVGRKDDCMALVELFERYPLRAKKARDFRIWARAVRIHQSGRQGVRYSVDRAAIDGYRESLRQGRPHRGKVWA